MRSFWSRYWWFNVSILCFSPIAITFIDQKLPWRNIWTESSVFLGFIALSLLFLQFLITARIRFISEEHGIDIVLQAHKKISYVILALIIIHPLILFIHTPSMLQILHPAKMPLRTLWGVLAVFSFFALIGFSIWRKQIGLSYEVWRITHAILAIAVVFFSALHVIEVHYYLSLIWKRVLWGGFSLIVIGLLAYVRIIKPMILLHKPWRVSSIKEEGGNCWSIQLEPIGHKGIVFHPGQFVWIKLDKSPLFVGDHPFTISSSAEKSEAITFTIKALGDFTKDIHKVPNNTRAYVDGPYGKFSYDHCPETSSIVMIAGGVGITPMISMLRTMHDRKEDKKIQLFYAAGSDEELLFYDELEKLKEELSLEIIYFLQTPHKIPCIQGFITKDILQKHIRDRSAHFFLCGPPKMNQFIHGYLKEFEIKRKQIHIERFDLV
jgi:predicted ferric reductase